MKKMQTIKAIVAVIIANLNLHNATCEFGAEVTIEEVIEKLKTKTK